MSFDDTFAASDLVDIYETFGEDAMVTRALAGPVPVRIVVDRNQERLGDHGQVIGRVDRVRCMVAQWTFAQGDRIAWTDRLGAHDKQVEGSTDNDGLESYGVLHG